MGDQSEKPEAISDIELLSIVFRLQNFLCRTIPAHDIDILDINLYWKIL